MISSKKLMRMARKWRNLAISSRKRITFSRTKRGVQTEDCSSSSVVKGQVVLYSADGGCFSIPLAYLDNDLFRELLRMAEEEYGLPSHGPIVLPCDAVFMEYVMCLIGRCASEDLKKAFLQTISTGSCSSSSCFHPEQSYPRSLICSY